MKTTIALALILVALQDQPLPKAEDVLPKGEVSKGSLVVAGDGFRYQVQPELKLVDDPRGKPAYKGTIEGMMSKAEITLYVAKEKFEGDLEALVKREREKVTSKTGKLSFDTPIKLFIGGALNPAHRFLAKVEGRMDLHVLAVHEGTAYVFHAETADKNSAFANVGSDLMIRGSTFHVAPPK
jgi:hypothetical protein